MATASFFSLLIATALIFTTAVAEIRSTEIRSNARSTIPFYEFGFTHSGILDLNVSQISLSYPNQNSKPDLSVAGFFLCTRDAWIHVLKQIADGEITCPIHSNLIKLVFSLDKLQGADQFGTSYKVSDANQFTLVFGNCIPNLKVSMNVHSAMYNFDGKTDHRDYLSAGKTDLLVTYFWILIFSSFAVLWIYIYYYSERLSVYRFHFFMLAVVAKYILSIFERREKELSLFFETEDKPYIKKTGAAHEWDVFSFLKGITLFTLIVLIGTGWSFLKRYLPDKEKKVLRIVIPLQVIAILAEVVIDARPESYAKQVLLLMGVMISCAVLFPIVWSIKHMRVMTRAYTHDAVNSMELTATCAELTLFREFYIVVICYIYFARVVGFAVDTITLHRYQWTSVVAGLLATDVFEMLTGYAVREVTVPCLSRWMVKFTELVRPR